MPDAPHQPSQSRYVLKGRYVNTNLSIQGGGQLDSDLTLSLVNDTTPEGFAYYGTDIFGERGWYGTFIASGPQHAAGLVPDPGPISGTTRYLCEDGLWKVVISGGGGGGSGTSMSNPVTQTTHGFAVGDVVRFNGTTYVKALADTSSNAEVVGLVTTVTDANTFTITTGGLVSGLSGLTSGSVYFLSTGTAGVLTATAPSVNGQISKPLLIASSTTGGYWFNWRGWTVGSPVGGGGSGGSVAWTDITGKPSTFPPTVPIAWTNISGKPSTFPPTLPVTESDVTNLVTDLAGKEPSLPSGGTTSNFLRGDKTWAVPAGGGGAVASVTGTAPISVSPTTGATVVSLTSPLGATYMPAFTGDVTKASGSTVTVLANIPTATPAAGTINMATLAAPTAPVSGANLYVDSTSQIFCCKDQNTFVTHGVRSQAKVTSQWIDSIADTGAITTSQPSFSNLAGTITTAQGGIPTGGTSGQALTKIDATNYNTQWTTLGGGTGTVTSITATSPVVVTPTPLTASGVISLTAPLTATYMPAFTGDITKASGSTVTVLANIPTATPAAGTVLMAILAAPTAPAPGAAALYVDSGSKTFSARDSSANITHTIRSRTSTASNWINSIADDGQTTISQPAFSDLSGSIAGTQLPAFTGDVTKPSGSTVTTLANIPTATPAAGTILMATLAAPTAPAPGAAALYVDSTSKTFSSRDESANITHTIRSRTKVTNSWLDVINDDGSVGTSQPSFSNLSGSIATTQGGIPVGGTTGQALTKINATDYNTQWTTLGGGTGTVTSITATSPVVVTPTPLTATGVVSLDKTVDLAMTAGQSITLTDAVTAVPTDVLSISHNSSGAAANSFGTGLAFKAEDTTTNDVGVGGIEAFWTTATHGSNNSSMRFKVNQANVVPAVAMTLKGSIAGGILDVSAGYTIAGAAASGKLLQGDGVKFVVSTPTWPTTAGTARKIIVSDGTNLVSSTETWAVPGASTNNVLKSDGVNWTAAQLAFSNLGGSATAGQMPAYTGDVTSSAGSAVNTLVNIPTATPAAGTILMATQAAPTTPVTGASLYVDSSSKIFCCKDQNTFVTHGVRSRTKVSNSWVDVINDDGSIGTSQPSFSNLSGTPTTLSGYGITDPVVLTSGSYSNPTWITSLAWSKITTTPTTLSGYGITDGNPAFTGDVTKSSGGTVTTLTNIPTNTTAAGTILMATGVAPSAPSTGSAALYVDSTSKTFSSRDSVGNITHTVRSATGLPSNNFINQINDDGTVGYAAASGAGGGGSSIGDSGITALVNGQAYIDVPFSTAQADALWSLAECEIVNTVDSTPLNISRGVITSKSTTGFRLQLIGLPDSSNYELHWALGVVTSGVITQNPQATNYTLVMADSGKHIFHDSATAHTYTIPANSSVAFPIGTTITIANNTGGGAITLAITTDTLRRGDGTAGTGSRTISADSIATILKTKSTEWMITGKFT